jgi:hypothetical protein
VDKGVSLCLLVGTVFLSLLLSPPSQFFAVAQGPTTSTSVIASSTLTSAVTPLTTSTPTTSTSTATSSRSTYSSTSTSTTFSPASSTSSTASSTSQTGSTSTSTTTTSIVSSTAAQTASTKSTNSTAAATATTKSTNSSASSTAVTSVVSVVSQTSSSTMDPFVPSIILSPSSGSAGLTVTVSGSGFNIADTTCSISGRVIASQTCTISGGTLSGAAFSVANVPGGFYTVVVRSMPSGNSASAQFMVNTPYSISFSPPYWLCTNVYVTFTGPLVESGLLGDTLQFQYFQYDPNVPSALNPIFTDTGLTVTGDTVSYSIGYQEYAPANFVYMPYIAVKVFDVTPRPNGYAPGLIFMQLTNISPESYQSCQIDSSTAAPEFQAQWFVVMISLAASLLFLRAHKRQTQPQEVLKGFLK